MRLFFDSAASAAEPVLSRVEGGSERMVHYFIKVPVLNGPGIDKSSLL